MPSPLPRLILLGALLAASALLAPPVLRAGSLGQPDPPAAASGCGAEPGGPAALDPGGSGPAAHTPFRAAVGVPFSLTLDSNRTTGYQWLLAEPLDSTILQLDSHVYTRPGTSLPGAGGTETWTFTPLCAGATTVTFVYRRPWEPPSPSDRRETYDITVEQATP
ncbi:MAG TPA: protease inhibitor I42 family protein [Chloroflexota bacterium]|nr:protease inhibitor I42 family protein [Chloroflexota bacterium]